MDIDLFLSSEHSDIWLITASMMVSIISSFSDSYLSSSSDLFSYIGATFRARLGNNLSDDLLAPVSLGTDTFEEI